MINGYELPIYFNILNTGPIGILFKAKPYIKDKCLGYIQKRLSKKEIKSEEA